MKTGKNFALRAFTINFHSILFIFKYRPIRFIDLWFIGVEIVAQLLEIIFVMHLGLTDGSV